MTTSAEISISSPGTGSGSELQKLKRRRFWMAAFVVLLLAGAYSGNRAWTWFRTRQFRQECDEARRSEDWRTERQIAKAWTTWDPHAAEAWWFAAESAQELEDHDDMAFCLGQIPRDDPKALMAYIEKANLEWTVLNRPLDAVVTSKLVLGIDPRITEIQARLISFYAMNLQRTELLKTIRSAIAAKGEPREAYVYLMLADLITFSNGSELNSRWLASSPDEIRFKIALAVHTAANIFQNADATSAPDAVEMQQEAERQLEWFLKSAPHDTPLLVYLMSRAYDAGNVERVGELLQNVDDASADDHMVWVYRGWYHTEMKEFTQAEEAIREALRLHPLSALAHHEYAKLLRLQQRPAAEVAHEQKLATEGKAIRAKLVLQASVRDVSWDIFEQILQYAADCDDQFIANALIRRIGNNSAYVPGRPDGVFNPPADGIDVAK